MPGKYYEYYTAVADRMVPYLADRRVAIEQRFKGARNITFRRHPSGRDDTRWIEINDRDEFLRWAFQYAEGFHANIRSNGKSAWFAIDIDSRELPIGMAQLAASHAAEVLAAQGLAAQVKYSGSDGFHLMWNTPNVTQIVDAELWEMERAVVRAVACLTERRLDADPAAQPIRDLVGADHPLITTANADRDNPNALLFDQYILKDNANFRVPYSVHPATGLVAAPIPTPDLMSFAPEQATPERVAADWPQPDLPSHSLDDVRAALAAWQQDGCLPD